MITLTTGVPGSGKSLYTIAQVKAKSEKENRPVYYSGIADLKLPWLEIDDPTKWDELETGAIIVIDECQRIFRPRAAGSKVPDYISAMETHRHKGYDIFLITQHPNLVDQNIRRLVGQHWHVVRKFGLQMATIHEWGSTHEITQRNLLAAVRRQFPYSKEVYGYYKSAEMHTHKAKVPKRVIFLLAAPLLIVGLGWYGYTRMMHVGKSDQPAAQVAQPGQTDTKQLQPSHVQTRAEYLQASQPRIDGIYATAPKYDQLTQPTDAPWPQVCMITKYFDRETGKSVDKCGCLDQQGNRYGAGDALCRDIALNGIFKDWGQNGPRRDDSAVQVGAQRTPEAVNSSPAPVAAPGLGIHS